MLDDQFVRAEEPLAADVDGEVVLLDPTTGDFFGLRQVAGRIWELFGTPQSVRTLVETLTTEYDVDEATCTVQVETFVGRLAEAGLVRTV